MKGTEKRMSDQSPYSSFPDHAQWHNQQGVHTFPPNDLSSRPQPHTDYQQQPGSYLPYPLSPPYAGYPQQLGYPPYYPSQQRSHPPRQPYASPENARSQRRRMGPAIASLVLGVIGILSFAYFIGFFVSIAGLILACVGMKRPEGKGIAVAGLILSIIGVVFGACVVTTGIFAHAITTAILDYILHHLLQ